eukprot:NODE_366_length_10082_cov_0.124211.p10 type:complete len:104 gc:universal NODE_366_length_10082_cov_0.124211:4438-4749(+)
MMIVLQLSLSKLLKLNFRILISFIKYQMKCLGSYLGPFSHSLSQENVTPLPHPETHSFLWPVYSPIFQLAVTQSVHLLSSSLISLKKTLIRIMFMQCYLIIMI